MSNRDYRTHQSYTERIHDNIIQTVQNSIAGQLTRVDAQIGLSANQTSQPLNTNIVVPFDSTIVDNQNIYNSGTNQFTIPVDGEYILNCVVLIDTIVAQAPGPVDVDLTGRIVARVNPPTEINAQYKDILNPFVGDPTPPSSDYQSLEFYLEGFFNTGDIIEFYINLSNSTATTGSFTILASGGSVGLPSYASVRQVVSSI